MSTTIDVVVADAHELMRAGLRMIIDSAPDLAVVGEAATGQQVLTLANTHRPHVALVEVGLPGMSGIDVIRQLANDPTSTTNVVMLTTYDHDQLVRESFRAGARGYLMKTAPPSMVLDAIRAAASPTGGSVLSPEIAQRLVDDTMLAPTPVRTLDHDLSTLSEAELRVLRQVARGHTNREVGARLLISEATVKSHMTSILRKLGLRDRVQCVIVAYEAGLVAPGRDTTGDRQG
jgi:DNA-binding NarL/FixJ family response regulator